MSEVTDRVSTLDQSLKYYETDLERMSHEFQYIIQSVAEKSSDIEKKLTEIVTTADHRLQTLSSHLEKASEALELLKHDQEFVSLVYRAQSYDVQAFHVLKKLALEGKKFSDRANWVVKDVETRLSNENLWILVFTPQETKGAYQYSGPFTTEEIQEAIDAGSLDNLLDYISGRKFTFFMSYLVETIMAENDLYRQTRIMRTISSLVGEKFYPWEIEQFKEWWKANRENYNDWPKQIYYNAKASFESGNYSDALKQFQKVIDFDNDSEKSKALAVACAIETGNKDLANQFISSFIYGDSRWQLWGRAKIALITEGALAATEKLADLSRKFPSFPERAYIHRKAHIWRQIDWTLYDSLVRDEKK
jgi:hypothetical protein